MKKLLVSLMAVSMLASMSTGVFADGFNGVPYFTEDDVIVLESTPETQRINTYTTKSFKANLWTTVAREQLTEYEDIMIKIMNISGASQVHVQVMKNGSKYVDRWMGLGDQFTFDADWNDGEYSIRFLTTTNSTITYSIKTVS